MRAISVAAVLLLLSQPASAATLERIEIADALTAWISVPGGPGPHPAAVLLHGCSGLTGPNGIRALYHAWSDILTKAGYAVLLPDSAGARGFGPTCTRSPERAVLYRERPGDAYAALAHLQALREIDPARIYLIGWSQGGGIALLTVSDKSIGRPDPPPTHDFRAIVAFYPSACDRLEAPFTAVAPGTWRPVAPLLILHGADDTWTRPGPCRALTDAAARRGHPVEMKIYPNAVHAFDAPDLPLHARTGVTDSRGLLPLVGTNQAARDAAIENLLSFLAANR